MHGYGNARILCIRVEKPVLTRAQKQFGVGVHVCRNRDRIFRRATRENLDPLGLPQYLYDFLITFLGPTLPTDL